MGLSSMGNSLFPVVVNRESKEEEYGDIAWRTVMKFCATHGNCEPFSTAVRDLLCSRHVGNRRSLHYCIIL